MWTTTGSFPMEEPSSANNNRSDESIPEQLARINRDRAALVEQEGKLLEKGLASYNPDILIKAQQHWNDIQAREKSNFKSAIIDPQDLNDSLGYKSKPQSVSFDLLRRMSRIPLVRAVISTRQAQVSAFARPQADRFDTGFVIRKKREYYSNDQVQIGGADKKEIKRLTDFLLNGGEKMHKWHGDNFEAFLKKIVEDSLSLDQGTFEVVRNNYGEPIQYLATDGATFRVASSYDDENYDGYGQEKEAKLGYYPSYVQIIDGEVRQEYYPWELCFGVRNTSSDIYRNGYGRSELEDLIEIVTYMLNADTYNGKFFTQGSNPKGIIKISGNVNPNRLAEFRQQWQSMVAGVVNAWKVPVLESDKMEWIDLQKNNTDMQFSTWQEYLLKVVCSVYKISPEELGFSVGNASGGSALMESGNEAKLKYSKDKGLIPLLKTIEYWINYWIISPLNEDFEFVFTGYDSDGREKELDLDIKIVNTFGGWMEARKKWNMPDKLADGDFPLNNVWIQRQGQIEMAAQQDQNNQAVDDMGQGEEEQQDPTWDTIDKGIGGNPFTADLTEFWDNLNK